LPQSKTTKSRQLSEDSRDEQWDGLTSQLCRLYWLNAAKKFGTASPESNKTYAVAR